MAHHSEVFPEDISFGSSGGPGMRTSITELQSGAEVRISEFEDPKYQYNAAYGIRSYADLRRVQEFFIARKGATHSFPYKDWLNFSTAETDDGVPAGVPTFEDQVLVASAVGGEDTIQLVRRYMSGSTEVVEPIVLPNASSLLVGQNGVAINQGSYSIDANTGLITLVNPLSTGDLLTAGCYFWKKCRFSGETDSWLNASLDDFASGTIQSIGIIEVISQAHNYDVAHPNGSFENTLTGNLTLPVNDARLLVFDPDAAGYEITLPDPDTNNIPTGADLYEIVNESATHGIIIKDHLGTTLLTLAAGQAINIHLTRDVLDNAVWYTF